LCVFDREFIYHIFMLDWTASTAWTRNCSERERSVGHRSTVVTASSCCSGN